MIETVLTIKKNCRQFVSGKPLFWAQFDHTILIDRLNAHLTYCSRESEKT